MTFPQWVVDIIDQTSVDVVAVSPPEVRAAAMRLVKDARMRPLWGKSFGDREFWRALNEFEAAVDRDHWSDKSQRERDAWLARFEKTVDTLLELMAEAPTTPERWGFPVRDNVLMNAAHRMGVDLPSPDDAASFFWRMQALEESVDNECWTLADSIKHYREQQRGDCKAKQQLKKPGDAKAGRASFIANMRAFSALTVPEIVTVAQVIFEDEAIDERLVRRLAAGNLAAKKRGRVIVGAPRADS